MCCYYSHQFKPNFAVNHSVKIKGRIIITRITRQRNAPPGQYSIQSQNIFVTYAPNSLKGVPATPPATENIKQSDLYPVEVVNSNEVWNIYKILNTGDRIKVKLVATEVFRVKDAYDQLGQPHCIITSGVMISPISKGISS